MSIAEAQQAQQALAISEQKIHTLEVEKTLAASSEQRLSVSISQVNTGFRDQLNFLGHAVNQHKHDLFRANNVQF